MRIGIDARMYGPKQGGLGRYAQQLILHLEKLDAANEYAIFLRRENWDEYEPSNPRFKKILADIHWYGWREQILLPRIFKKENIDLMHFPHWNAPFFYNKPFTATIHDLLPIHYPTRRASTLGPIGYFLKHFFFKKVLRHAARRAKKIITVSEFSKNDIVKTLGIHPDKISVTYPAPMPKISNFQFPISNKFPNDTISNDALKIKYGITQPYILYVGVAFPHKNLERLLEAWKIFQEKNGRNYQLVLAGSENYFYKKLIDSSSSARNNNVIFTGFIPDSDLPALYANASLYVFPSLYEGFGLPPLEAMQYGAPVISSNRACLPEVLKDAALYFNPENTAEIADAIRRGLADENLRAELVALGQKLCSSYSWRRLAEQTLKIYSACG